MSNTTHSPTVRAFSSCSTVIPATGPGEVVQILSDGSYALPSVDAVRRYGVLADLVEAISTSTLLQRLKDEHWEEELEMDRARRLVARSPLKMEAYEQLWVLSAVQTSLGAAS